MSKKYLIICVLLTLIVSFAIPITDAIYKSASGSNKSVPTAEWDVSLNQTGISNNILLQPGGAARTYTLKVRSDSEVDVKYSIVISNIPAGVEVSLNGVDYETPSSNSVTFSNAGQILYSSQARENTHTIYFVSEAGSTNVVNQSVTINVIAEQLI